MVAESFARDGRGVAHASRADRRAQGRPFAIRTGGGRGQAKGAEAVGWAVVKSEPLQSRSGGSIGGYPLADEGPVPRPVREAGSRGRDIRAEAALTRAGDPGYQRTVERIARGAQPAGCNTGCLARRTLSAGDELGADRRVQEGGTLP